MEDIINQFFEDRAEKCEIDIWYASESMYKYLSLPESLNPDILFLDIELPEDNGVDAGRYIRKVLNDDSMNIIYISHKTSYALELFQNHPYDFLVKPISKTILYTTLTKLLRLDEVQNKKFRYTYNKIGYSVHYGDILYFSSRNKTVFIYKTNGDVLSYYGKLKDIINKLPFQFVCIGKSFIINLKYIKSWKSDSVLLEDGTELGIAQSRRADFKKAIYNYGM